MTQKPNKLTTFNSSHSGEFFCEIFIGMNKDLTIVIPCKNEGINVIKVIKHILAQNDKYKVIISDSSDEYPSILLLKKYVEMNPSQIEVIPGGLPGIARNNGAKLVKTPYILFLDADIFIKKHNFLEKCLKKMKDNDYDLLTCKLRTENGKFNWVYRFFDIIQWISSVTKPFAVGGFMLFKTSKFNELGGFNEEDKICEDYHLSSKIQPKKFKILNKYVYTTPRRFENKGVWYMIKLAFSSWWNRNNDEWFKKDYNYWKYENKENEHQIR